MNDKLLNFVNTYTGIPNVGNTPENKGQCVGLIEIWLDLLMKPHVWGDAKDLLANASLDIYTVVYNDPSDTNQHPNPGDVIVLGASWGAGVGHTGVIMDATGVSWTGFEQNNPTGHAPQVLTHNNYNGVLGWFFPKDAVITQPIPQLTLNDQTKIPAALLGTDQDEEIQAIRGLLKDGKACGVDLTNTRDSLAQVTQKRDTLAAQLSLCMNNQNHTSSLTLADFSTKVLLITLWGRIWGSEQNTNT